MKLRDFLKDISRQDLEEFAAKCGTTVGQLRQVSLGNRRAGESLAINIERESLGVIRCEELRPDVDWAYLRKSGDKAA